MFKHLKPQNLRNRGMDSDDIKKAYQVADVTGLGFYPQNVGELDGQALRSYIKDVKTLTSKSLYLWETGLPTASSEYTTFTELQQKQWIETVDRVVREEGILGYNIWLYTDIYHQNPNKVNQHGLYRLDGTAKPSIEFLLQ